MRITSEPIEEAGDSEGWGWPMSTKMACRTSATVWVCTVLMFAVQSFAQESGSITGRIVDAAGTPLPSAVVAITSIGLSTTTDGEGRFTFSGVGEGTYAVEVNRQGYGGRPSIP